jgi:3'(2'), 5'-bisphosphate nucleotidase
MNRIWDKINIERVNEIAIEAGVRIMDIYENADFSKIVDFKTDNSPLTLADKEANKVIEAGLAGLEVQLPVLSEEGRDIPYEERKGWSLFWLVDPLDGTKEFIKKNGEFTVNIALIENGLPVMGVIYAPAFKTLYYGKQKEGSYKRENGVNTRLTVNNKKDHWAAVGSRSHSSSEEQALLSKYPVTDSVSIGSSLKFCLLAEGKADIYYRHGPTMEWDTGAGQAILEASGGTMMKLDKSPFSYNKKSLKNESFLCLGNSDYRP